MYWLNQNNSIYNRCDLCEQLSKTRAVDEAKAVSDYVTDNVWDEGITAALKEFSFI